MRILQRLFRLAPPEEKERAEAELQERIREMI
jgi:hypothetical protein